jgi:outer membrane protein assembly factor BamB
MQIWRGGLAVIVGVFVASSSLRAQAPGADWPQWRGPNRNGTLGSFTPPDRWPERLTRRWQIAVGDGYATPVLVGDHVYMFSRQAEDETMRALDAASGDVVWSTSYPAPFSFDAAADPHGPGPKATPTFAAGRLYTLGLGGVVTAFDAANGDIAWQVPASPIGPLFGTAASPLVDGDLVIVHVGGHDDGALTAFDAATGAVRWAWSGDGPSYASPVVVELHGTRQVITQTQDHVVAVDTATGALLWQRPFTTPYQQNSIDPVVVDGLVIVSGTLTPTVAFRVLREAGAWTTEDVWENAEATFYMTNGLLVDRMLFGLTERNRGQYILLDTTSGETIWTSEGRRAENAAIVRAGQTVFSLEDDAELIVGRVTPTGFEETRRYDVGDSATWAQPTISGNRVFVKDVTTLTLWTFD